ncbi:erv1/Alr family protein isoform X2 [Tasmannia lanceolata]|uniref:erv1/Alr family protein isoform X2 n=1 Tax=Tasmannia lanceolata TaxID=3420 RepID=UPI0040647190
MSENPFQIFVRTYTGFAQCIQTHLSRFIAPQEHQPSKKHPSLFSIQSKSTLSKDSIQLKESPSDPFPLAEGQSARPLSKEELGRATWTLLHTLAAQFPDHPTRQQKRDAKELMAIMSRLYPCKECADHFKEVLNLGKVMFPCQRVDARWGKLECKDRACDLQGITTNFSK